MGLARGEVYPVGRSVAVINFKLCEKANGVALYIDKVRTNVAIIRGVVYPAGRKTIAS